MLAMSSAVLLFCFTASSFNAVQNSSSIDRLVRCPAMVIDRLIGPSVIVYAGSLAIQLFALKLILPGGKGFCRFAQAVANPVVVSLQFFLRPCFCFALLTQIYDIGHGQLGPIMSWGRTIASNSSPVT